MTHNTQVSQKYLHIGNSCQENFLVQLGCKTIQLFLPTDGEDFWLLLQSAVSLLSSSTVQPENA